MNTTPLEADEQKELVEWLKSEKLDFFAPINENNHSKANRLLAIKLEAKAKSMGKIKGVSDIVVFTPTKILFIELKRLKGSTTSQDQKDFIERANKYPYAEGRICKGCAKAIEFIEEYK